MILIGIVSALALPRLGNTLAHQDVRGARTFITAAHARARASAISRGRRTAFAIAGGRLAIRSQHPLTGVVQLVGGTIDTVTDRFGVTLTIDPSTRDTLVFDPRGLGMENTSTTIIITKRGFADTVEIAPLGRIRR
jgi:Tfp pilus assembly protein FimT